MGGGSTLKTYQLISASLQAVMKACEELMQKLEPYREQASDWLSVVKAARRNCADLHAKYQ